MNIRSLSLMLICIFNSGLSYAVYDEADLKKLFTDKKQRAQIDARRSGKHTVAGSDKTSQVKVSGYVTRSDGKGVVWLNNKNTLEGARMGNVRVRESSIGKNKKVTISIDGKSVHLKPGETWSEGSGISDITN